MFIIVYLVAVFVSFISFYRQTLNAFCKSVLFLDLHFAKVFSVQKAFNFSQKCKKPKTKFRLFIVYIVYFSVKSFV